MVRFWHPNVSAMRNRGGRVAKGRWIFFMDEDCCVQVDKVFDLIMKIEDSDLHPWFVLVVVTGWDGLIIFRKFIIKFKGNGFFTGLSGRVIQWRISVGFFTF